MIINNITPNIKSLTLLKKYISIQLFTQLKLLMYSSGLSILKLGFAPAFDHNSYQLFIKFTSDKEYEYITPQHQIEMLHVIWGAKEAMFKKYGKGGVLFKEHIFVHPFTCEEKGHITVSFLKENQEETCTFKYQFHDNYCLVYSTCHL